MRNTNSLSEALNLSVGAQLYSIQDELDKDLHGTLKKIADIGYSHVETANVLSKESASVLKQALDCFGLNCYSAQFNTPRLFDNTENAIEIALELGIHYLVASTPWVEDSSRRINFGDLQHSFLNVMLSLTLEDWKWSAEQFNRVGEQIKQAGLKFGYHNHGFDFKFTDSEIPFELLLHLTDANLVAIELDCGWVANAGYDPVDFITQYPDRIKLLHIKDVKKKDPTTDFDIKSVAVGQGFINWKSVFCAAKAAGVHACYVELEQPFTIPPIELLKISHDHLQTLEL